MDSIGALCTHPKFLTAGTAESLMGTCETL